MEQKKEQLKFPGFPEKPVENYWQYPKVMNGYWHQLSGTEQKVLDYILRHTWGYQKNADTISLNQFQKGIRNKEEWIDRGIGISIPSIISALTKLKKKGFIVIIKATSGYTNSYKIRTENDTNSEILLTEFLFNEVKGKCPFCGVKMLLSGIVYQNEKTGEREYTDKDKNLMTIHHITPKSKGGSINIKNLIACCRVCNSKIGNNITEDTKEFLVSHTKRFLVSPTKDSLHTINNVTINNRQYTSKEVEKPSVSPSSYGNKDINDLIILLKEEFGISILDGSEKENRRYCWLALKKFKGSGVKAIIQIGARDKFWKTKITSFKTLYYNGVKIASILKEKQERVVKI